MSRLTAAIMCVLLLAVAAPASAQDPTASIADARGLSTDVDLLGTEVLTLEGLPSVMAKLVEHAGVGSRQQGLPF